MRLDPSLTKTQFIILFRHATVTCKALLFILSSKGNFSSQKLIRCPRMTWLIIDSTLLLLVITVTYMLSKAFIRLVCTAVNSSIEPTQKSGPGSYPNPYRSNSVWVAFSSRTLQFGLTYRLFCFYPMSQLFWHIKSTRPGHSLSRSSFNHEPWSGWCFYWHQGNNLLRCQNHEVFLISDSLRSYNLFQFVVNDRDYCLCYTLKINLDS